MKQCVIASIPQDQSVDTIVNNFSEADFDTKNISYISNNGSFGKLKKLALPIFLQKYNINTQDLDTIQQDRQKGDTIITIVAEQGTVKAVYGMFADYKPNHILTL